MSTRIRLQEAFKFALSMVLMYWLGLWMDWDLVKYGPLAILLISLSTSGASISKGVMRVIGTVIGCVVGLILVALFSQERWSMMFVLAGYLVFITYFMQASRYPYAWFVAGFVPLVIWSDTYGAVDNSFHFAIFRLLETVSGVLIYSLISVLLWPQTAGKQFYQLGGDYLDQLCLLIRLNKDALSGIKNNDVPAVQRKLDVLSAQLQATLRAALYDTMVVREQKSEWLQAMAALRAMTDNLMLWRSIDEEYLRINPTQNQPEILHALETIGQRCARIGEFWRARQLPSEADQKDDKLLFQKLSLDLSLPHTMTNVERGLLITQVDQLQQIDQQSRNLLILLRALNGLDSNEAQTDALEQLAADRVPRWDSVRILKSLIPALAFITGFLFWIYPTNPPPTGQAIAMMSGVFGLIVGLGANIRYVPFIIATGGLLVVAPIYFFIMPWLHGGLGLLTMIFLLCLFFGYLGGRWPMIKLGGLVLFVMTTNISNDQSYSFIGWISGEFMLIMSGIITNVVVMFVVAMRPEKMMARQVRVFFHACAVVTREFINVSEKKRKDKHFMRVVRRAPVDLRAVERTLGYNHLPAYAQERMNHLLNSIESVSARLRVVKTLIERVKVNASSIHPLISPLGVELPHRLHRLFESWAKTTKSTGVTEEERSAFVGLYQDLEERLETYHADVESPNYSEQMATDYTALISSVRGLLEVMAVTDQVIHDISWEQYVEPRF